MTPDDPRHGEFRGYHQHLRDGEDPCEPCDEARRRYQRRRYKMAARGMPRRVPIGDKIHARLVDARLHGMTQQEIAKAVGVSPSCVSRYIRNPDHLVSTKTWLKLARFHRRPVLTTTGTIRRIQAMHHLGWGCAAIAREAGCCKETLTELIRGRDLAGHRLRESIAAVYDRLWSTPCTDSPRVTTRAKGRAARSKWAPPLAWDDDTIDDPKARPAGVRGSGRPHKHEVDEVAVLRAVHGDRTVNLTKAERAEVSRRLRAAGWTFAAIEAHTGLKADRYLEAAA